MEKIYSLKQKKKTRQNTGVFNTYTSSGLAHYLLCGDSLSTNFLMMKTDSYNTSTYRAFYFDNSLCIWVCVKQPFIFAAWTGYMYLFPHSFTPPITCRNHIESDICASPQSYQESSFLLLLLKEISYFVLTE